jgi:dTDP-glucose pyrophosphorylase
VVVAAGEGRRLRPLTELWPKAALPIDGRPVVATLLREIAAAGIEDVTVVTGHLAEQVEALLGDGSSFALSVRFARQREPLGSADAVRCAVAAGASPPFLVSAADTVYRAGDLRRAADRWLESGSPGGIGVREVPVEALTQRALVRVEQGLVRTVIEKPPPGHPTPGKPQSALAGAPLWFLGADLAAALPHVPGPPHELAYAFQRSIDEGRQILALPLGPTRDLTTAADVIRHNFPYLWSSGDSRHDV